METTELFRILAGTGPGKRRYRLVFTVAVALTGLTLVLVGLRFGIDGLNTPPAWILLGAALTFAASAVMVHRGIAPELAAALVPVGGGLTLMLMPFLDRGLLNESLYWIPLVPGATSFFAPRVRPLVPGAIALACLGGLLAFELHAVGLEDSELWQPLVLRAGAFGTAVLFGTVLATQQEAYRRHEQKQLWHEASHHPVSGLKNRYFFLEVLRVAIERGLRGKGVDVGLLFLDLDGLKATNDTYGHQAGDAFIRESGQRLAARVRAGDVACHIAGDEFTVIIEPCTGTADAKLVAQRLCEALHEPIEFKGKTILGSASVGAAVLQEGETAEDLIRRADRAMYRAKQSGGNRVAVDDPTPETQRTSA